MPLLKLFPGESVMVDAMASMFRGIEGVGGRITVTNFRVWFEPHALNIQSDPEELPLNAIVDVGKRNTWGFIPNGMYIRMNNGVERRFITWKREKIIAAVQSQIKR